jgi:hypothetical protein
METQTELRLQRLWQLLDERVNRNDRRIQRCIAWNTYHIRARGLEDLVFSLREKVGSTCGCFRHQIVHAIVTRTHTILVPL